MMLGERVQPGQYEIVLKQLGLDRPLIVQFGQFWLDILRGDWGDSIWRHQSALSLVSARLPATVELAVASFIITMLLSIPAGIFAAVKRGSKSDQAVMSIAVLGQAWPSFWMGIIMILVFSVQLGWFPTHGRGDATPFFGVELLSFSFHTLDGLKHLVLPAIVLAFLPMAIIARITRSAMLEVLRQDYIRTARAKGLHEGSVLLGHAVKNAAIPVVTIVGIQTGFFLAGAVITETVFAWPRSRQRGHRGHPEAGLRGGAGRDYRHRFHLRVRKPCRRHDLRISGSEDKVQLAAPKGLCRIQAFR